MKFFSKFFTKNILVFSRMHISNFGDPIIGDCCKYIIEKTAKEDNYKVNVTIADVYSENDKSLESLLAKQNAVVFPGGGMNSVVFNRMLLEKFELIQKYPKISVFFNAIGILRVKPKKKNEELLKELYSKPQVKQVTTRGDLEQLKNYIPDTIAYPPTLIFDPAIWVNEAYQISGNANSDVIGIGVIRPEIYSKNGNEFSENDVLQMYINIIHELDARNHKWQLFCNGMKEDYNFAVKIAEELNLNPKECIGKNVKNCRELVKKIAGYKAVIAARLHANIIATSLEVPSVGLVWNDKMNLFAQIIGCEDRYLGVDKLLDSKHIVDTMEKAIEEGYNQERIDNMKEITVRTIRNIYR